MTPVRHLVPHPTRHPARPLPVGRLLLLTLLLGLNLAAAQIECNADNTLTAATIDKPVNMDPAFAELYASMQVYQHVFAKLVQMDETYQIQPDIAESWSQESPTSWLFELRQDATFHNGDPVTARDVKYSLDRVQDPDLGASNAIFITPITSVEVVDDYTVRINVEENWGGLLPALAAVSDIVSERAVTELEPRLEPVGAGPYRFEEWVPDDHITLVRHEGYHGPQPGFDCLVMRAIAEDTVRLTGLTTGELGWIEQVPLQMAEGLKTDERVAFAAGAPYLPDLILFNNSRPPFDDVRARQAVAWALDREAIRQLVFFGQAVAATEAIPPGHPLFSGVDPYADGPDLERARALIEEAGLTGTTVQFAGQPQVATAFKTGQLIQDQLRKIGLEVEINSYESGQWFEALATGNYDFTITFWSATADPEHIYYPLLKSDSPWNFGRYASERMDEALDAFRYAPTPEAREEAYDALIAVVQDEVPFIFTINKEINYWTAPDVTGAQPSPTLELNLESLRPGN